VNDAFRNGFQFIGLGQYGVGMLRRLLTVLALLVPFAPAPAGASTHLPPAGG
jgi:hypothetical protein